MDDDEEEKVVWTVMPKWPTRLLMYLPLVPLGLLGALVWIDNDIAWMREAGVLCFFYAAAVGVWYGRYYEELHGVNPAVAARTATNVAEFLVLTLVIGAFFVWLGGQ
jgi:hypothetical protein